MALSSWLSSLWHSAGPTLAAVAAVATGNPELAAPAAAAASAAGGGKPNPPKAPPVVLQPVAAVPPPGSGSFAQAYQALSQTDKEIVLVGGGVVGAAVLYRVLFGGRRR